MQVSSSGTVNVSGNESGTNEPFTFTGTISNSGFTSVTGGTPSRTVTGTLSVGTNQHLTGTLSDGQANFTVDLVKQ